MARVTVEQKDPPEPAPPVCKGRLVGASPQVRAQMGGFDQSSIQNTLKPSPPTSTSLRGTISELGGPCGLGGEDYAWTIRVPGPPATRGV